MTSSTKNAQAKTQSTAIAVTKAFVAGKLGINEVELVSLLANHPWPKLSYRHLDSEERDQVILGILSSIDAAKLRVAGKNDNTVWERGWGEILTKVKTEGFNPSILRPQYFDHHRIMRFDGDFIDGGDAHFNYAYDQLLRRLFFAHYLKGAAKIVELGCGTGTSQLILAELFPQAKLVASDWAKPSQELIRIIGQYVKRDIKPVNFNMLTLEGWDELTIDHESCVLTVHALEQLGGNMEPLMDKLIAAKPRFCLHLEPILELYDETKLFDHVAIKYHRHRNYLQGWLTRLRALAREGKVEILEERRLGFGGRDHEAFTAVKWRAC